MPLVLNVSSVNLVLVLLLVANAYNAYLDRQPDQEVCVRNVLLVKVIPRLSLVNVHHVLLVGVHQEAESAQNVLSVKILTLEESRAFEEAYPECILDSLWAERWKGTDEEEPMAKSRWCRWMARSGHTRD